MWWEHWLFVRKSVPKQRVQPGPGNTAITPILPSTPPCILGFLPSSPDLLLRTELCPTDLSLPCPRPSVATRVLKFALVPAPFWTIRLFQNWTCQLQKNLSPVLTAEIQNLGNQHLACRLLAALGNALVQPVVLFWTAFHSGRTMLSFRTFPMGLGGSVSVPDTDFCNLQIATTFILQSGMEHSSASNVRVWGHRASLLGASQPSLYRGRNSGLTDLILTIRTRFLVLCSVSCQYLCGQC